MNSVNRFRFRNTMLIANVISNIIGVTVVFYLARRAGMMQFTLQSSLFAPINLIFIPLSFLIPIAVTLIYERPIRKYLRLRQNDLAVAPVLSSQVHQRLLNEPFFLMALNGLVWISAATVYAFYFWRLGMSRKVIWGAFSLNLQVGLVSVTVAFFVIEFFLQRRLAPYFFPHGGMSAVSKTIRIRIRTRLIAFLTATNLIPMFTLVRGSWGITQSVADSAHALSTVQMMIFSHAVIFAGVGIWLTFLVSSNLTRPLADMTSVLKRIKGGHFDDRVSVTSNDELGFVGDAVNEMASGLKEREFIKETFGKYVSKEVRDEVLSRHIPLDGEGREVSVLFADLRNFTPLVERTTPQQVVRILNRYFEEMEIAIRAQGGLILQFIGDEIEAVFGAPVPLADHATQAMIAAINMNHGLAAVNKVFADRGHPPLQHGIGIHSGNVVAANIGSPSRLSYALVGDTVNVASRLQDANKQHGTSIIVSAETHRRLSRDFPLRRLPMTTLKGKREPMQLFGL
jgi:adenylate cyclase